jgi:hypothetical protein
MLASIIPAEARSSTFIAGASVTAVPLLFDLAHLLAEETAVHQTTILLFACCGRGNGRTNSNESAKLTLCYTVVKE